MNFWVTLIWCSLCWILFSFTEVSILYFFLLTENTALSSFKEEYNAEDALWNLTSILTSVRELRCFRLYEMQFKPNAGVHKHKVKSIIKTDKDKEHCSVI